jgi:hypothetical protein
MPITTRTDEPLGQPQPGPASTTIAGAGKGLAAGVMVLTGIIVVLALATLCAYVFDAGPLAGLFVTTVIASFAVGIPLLVSSVRLVALDRRWWPLSIAGIVVGGGGIAAFALSVVVLIALGVACGGEGCLR